MSCAHSLNSYYNQYNNTTQLFSLRTQTQYLTILLSLWVTLWWCSRRGALVEIMLSMKHSRDVEISHSDDMYLILNRNCLKEHSLEINKCWMKQWKRVLPVEKATKHTEYFATFVAIWNVFLNGNGELYESLEQRRYCIQIINTRLQYITWWTLLCIRWSKFNSILDMYPNIDSFRESFLKPSHGAHIRTY